MLGLTGLCPWWVGLLGVGCLAQRGPPWVQGGALAPRAEPRAQGPKGALGAGPCAAGGGLRGRDPPMGHGGRGAPLVSFHVRPQYAQPDSRWYLRFGVSCALAPSVLLGARAQETPNRSYHRETRFPYRGRRSFSDQGGPPPTMPYARPRNCCGKSCLRWRCVLFAVGSDDDAARARAPGIQRRPPAG